MDRLTPSRVKSAFEATGFKPASGIFRYEGSRNRYACPVCAVVRDEHGVNLGLRGDGSYAGVDIAANLLDLPRGYVKSFMTAYDGLRYDLFESSDAWGIADGETVRREIPPEWRR